MPQLQILINNSKINGSTILAKSFRYPSQNQNTYKVKINFNSFAFVSPYSAKHSSK
jgi:hypothetical protein